MTIFLKLFALTTLVAFVFSTITLVSKKGFLARKLALWVNLLCGLLALLHRWYQAGQLEVAVLSGQGLAVTSGWPWLKTMLSHPPCTNLFEVLVALSWSLVIVALVVEKKYRLNLFAPLATGVALLCQGAAFWALDATIDPLAPVLRSWWLHLHVAVAAFSYAAAMAAALVAYLYLLKERLPRWQLYSAMAVLAVAGPLAFFNGRAPWNLVFLVAAGCVLLVILLSLLAYNKIGNLELSSERLDILSGKLVAITFITLTLVLVTGSVWAHYSWGRFWSWDPKETWSLVAWLCYGFYLELRYVKHFPGRPLAYLALLAILVVLFAFLGVNLGLGGAGMHTYGRG